MDELNDIVHNGRMPSLVGVGPTCRIGYNLVTIVAAVVVRKLRGGNYEVLMMQEAKPSCRGLWYLPAGRLEPNESLEEGVKREGLEETGLHFQPTAILTVESQRYWRRFTFTGCIIGGTLKTTENSDKESLQAKWLCVDKIESDLPLRAPDIVPLIRKAIAWHNLDESARCTLMPTLRGHAHNFVGVLLFREKKRDWSGCQVLSKEKEKFKLPFAQDLSAGLQETIEDIVQKEKFRGKFNVHGLCAVEHLGKPSDGSNDGIALTVVAEVTDSSKGGIWIDVSDPAILQVLQKAVSHDGRASIHEI